MRRTLLLLAAGLGLLAALLPARWLVRAQTPPNYQTITGVTGYQFAVPSDWQQLPLFLEERVGSQTFTDDGEVASADGQQHAHVETAGGFGITPSNINDALTAFLTGLPNIFAGPGTVAMAPGGAGPSGSSATPSGSGSPPAPALSLFAQPSSVTVPGADAAVAGASSYTDPDGNPRMIAARMAVKGSTAYLLIIDSTKDFYQNNPAVGAIETSFTLTPGASGSTASATPAAASSPAPAATASATPAATGTATP